MKPDVPDDTRLSALLRAWRPSVKRSPGFADRVWQHIARDERSREEAWNWSDWVDRWLAPLGHPAVATVFLALLLLTGSGLGLWRAHEKARDWDLQLGHNYVRLVSPNAGIGP